MPFEVHAISDKGHVRSRNEDMFLVDHRLGRADPYGVATGGSTPLLVAVADGMGGHAHGEIASRRVLELLDSSRSAGRLPSRPEDHRAFADVLVNIHNQLVDEGNPDEGPFRMGSTLVGAWFLPPDGLVRFHAGDSRLYRLRDGRLDQLTEDHSIRNQMLRSGADPGNISRHLVSSCLGGGVESPTVDTETEQPHRPGDRYMLCSDGLTDMVPDDRIAILLAGGNTRQAAEALVAAALEAGGRDNVTVVVVSVTAG